MPQKHVSLYEKFVRNRDENRKRVMELYQSRKAEFDALADKLGPADLSTPDVRVATAEDLSGVSLDNIMTINLDFGNENVKKMLESGELKKAVEWTDEDAAQYNPLCLCGCGRRGPLPAPGEWVPEGWRPTEEDRVFCCTDSVTPQGFLANRHEGHQIATPSEECDLTVSDK